jgi:tetratricopeptide (TPR) repeat protein
MIVGQRPPIPRGQNILLAQTFQQALAFHRQGRLGEAARLYRAALRHDSAHFDALYNLGFIEIQQGDFESGARRVRKALRQRPQSAEAENLLGVALRRMCRPEESASHFENALAIKPDFADAHYNFAGALRELNRLCEAASHYEKALAQNAAYVQAHFDLASLLRIMGDSRGAIAHFDAVLALKPGHAAAHNGRAHALREIGQIEDAQIGFEAAIALEPENAEFHYNLTFSKCIGESDPQLPRLEALAQDMGSRRDEERVLLHFALGKAYGDIGHHERSMPHLLAGNALKRKYTLYDEAEALAALDRISDIFSAEIVEERRGLGHPSDAPIFIVGMPRSGSTLVEQILASHPNAFGSGELMDFAYAVAGLDGPHGLPLDVGGEELRHMGARYLERVGADRRTEARVTDKMLGNFRLVGLIHLALPNAKIIHTRRDPFDTCFSCFSHLFALGQGFTYDLGELGRYYRAYEALMAHWRQVIPGHTMLDVQYENVVAGLEVEARRIIDFCGLEWDAGCLDFHRTQRPIKTASVTQVRKPVYRSSIGRWKPYREMLGPLLGELGASPPAPYHETGPD